MPRATRSVVCTAFLLALALCWGEAAWANHYILPCSGNCLNGRWVFTGTLNVARSWHTATLLRDGRVLVAGGRDDTLLASAELYDPATGQWTVTGSMSIPRAMHTATLLADGRVLVAGGSTSNQPPDFGVSATAEIYDPATGTWSPTGSMAARRFWYAATLLRDGRVLVAGGANPDNVAGAELYDPGSGSWTTSGKLQIERYGHTMTTLSDGNVLIAGGSNDGDLGSTLAAAELYDPASGSSHAIASPGWGGVLNTATLLATGQVLVAGGNGGGMGGDLVFAAAALFDPATASWTPAASLAARRYSHAATRLLNGSILITGGSDQRSNYPTLQYLTLGSTELYDPAKAVWAHTPNLNLPRSDHTSTLLADGTVLVVGGVGAGGSCELYVRGLIPFALDGRDRNRRLMLEAVP